MSKDVKLFIEHILDSINKIEMFVNGVTEKNFLDDLKLQDALVRRIEIIGEAVKNIPQEFKEDNKNIPWKDIAGMRDKLMHQYFGVDFEKVWRTVKEDIPNLKEKISKIKKG